MSVSFIPAVVLIIVIVFSASSEQKSAPGVQIKEKSAQIKSKSQLDQTEKTKQLIKKYSFKKDSDVNFKKVTNKPVKENMDYETIYKYISNKFKKISKEDIKKITENLIEHGKKHNVDPKFGAAVIARESGFNKKAISSTGAKGLGQIKDFNYASLGIDDPFNINQNVSGTMQYLKKMINQWKAQETPENKPPIKKDSMKETKVLDAKNSDRSESDVKLALASYFKGFTAVKKTGIDEKTNKYVEDIIKEYKEIIKYEKVKK